MECPYKDCSDKHLAAGADGCPTCGRVVKACGECGAASRAFANFCRACGTPLAASQGDWTGFKGGARRLGLNPRRQAHRFRELEAREVLAIDLPDHCRSLLSWDRHLVAVAESGRIEVADPATDDLSLQLVADGPITADPCIDRGVLYLGREGRIAAHSLSALTLPSPGHQARWEARVDGTPIRSLLAFENRLYFNAVLPDGRHSIQVLDGIDHRGTPESRTVYTAPRLSSLAGDPGTRRVVFLSEEAGGIVVHALDHARGAYPEVQSRRVPSPLLPLVTQVPIATMGAKIFAVFGEEDSLCRIDLDLGLASTVMRSDAKRFSLNRFREWVQVETVGIAFPHLPVRDDWTHMERARGQPVIVRDCAAAVGMQDGRILVYDLQSPPYHWELDLGRKRREVTALASYGSYLAAGDGGGAVKVFELLPKPG